MIRSLACAFLFSSLLLPLGGIAASAQEPEAPQAEEAADRYALPEGADVEALLAFLEGLQKFKPENIREFYDHREKAPAAMKAAAEKILELDKDPASAAHQKAQGLLLQARAQTIGSANPKEQRETLDAVKNHLAGKEIVIDDLRLAMGVARALEYGNATELAADAYASFGELAAKSKDAQIAGTAEMFHGAGRRLGLIGNEMELKGSTVDGKEFDLASLKGKVVLVDFWATWCGPCLAEYPNIKKNYEAYKDRGFEVVGISLDADRGALENYLKEKEVPWITLHEQEKNGQHPAAQHYGITGIPAMFLVNAEGKVISLSARGETLTKLLASELGPADAKE